LRVSRIPLPRQAQLALVAIVVLVVAAVVISSYSTTRSVLFDQYARLRSQIEHSLVRTLAAVDRGGAMVDAILGRFERPALELFHRAYLESRDIADLDLDAVRVPLAQIVPSELAQTIDLYVIDTDGIIVATTYVPDLGLDFSRYPAFFSSLALLFEEGGFRTDEIRPEIATGELKRFSYLRTEDGEYVLELGLTLPAINEELAAYGEVAQALAADAWELVAHLYLYDAYGVRVPAQQFAPTASEQALLTGTEVDDGNIDTAAAIEEALTTGETVRIESRDRRVVESFIPVRLTREASLEPIDRVIEVAFDPSPTREVLRRLLGGYLAGSIAVIVFTTLVGSMIVRRTTWPITSIIEEVAAIGSGDLSHRVTVQVEGELEVLKHNVNAMVDRLLDARQALEETVEERNESLRRIDSLSRIGQIAAAVAHDLSTPISVALQAFTFQESEIKEKQTSLAATEDESTRKLVDNLHESATVGARSLSRAASVVRSFKRLALGQIDGEETRFDVVDVVRDVAVTLEVIARRRGIRIAVNQRDDDVTLLGVEGAFAQMMANLVENAVRHAFPDSWQGQDREAEKTIAVTVSSDSEHIVVVVEDNGVGIPEERSRAVFEPFYTTKPNAGGTGLGLAIAEDYATTVLHGTIVLSRSKNGGAMFTMTFPRRTRVPGDEVEE
jgi:signal transduction histidine kinase